MTHKGDLRKALISGALITTFSVTASVVPVWIWLQIDPVIDAASIYICAFVLPLLISPTCSFFILRARMQAEKLARANHKLANVDELTELPNRRAFFRIAQTLQSRAAPSEVFVCAIADIDNFKRVNDAFGHDAGDSVLRAVGGILRAEAPEGGIAARLGGEEFALAAVFPSEAAARDVMARLVAKVREEICVHGDTRLRVTISLGYAPASVGETVSAVLTRADAALYQAKYAGKDCAFSAQDIAGAPRRERRAHPRRAYA